MRNFMRKTARRVSDAQPSNWASLCLNSDIFSSCSNHRPQIRSIRLSSVSSTSALSAARCGGELLAARRSSPFDGRPSRVCSGAELLLLLAAASTTAALLLLPAVTLHRLHRAVTKLDDALPHGLQHRCESRSTTPAPHLSHRPSHSASRRRLPLRGAPRTQLLPARLSQRQPVGVHAAGPDHQLRANFPGARAARSASPPRSGARRKKWA